MAATAQHAPPGLQAHARLFSAATGAAPRRLGGVSSASSFGKRGGLGLWRRPRHGANNGERRSVLSHAVTAALSSGGHATGDMTFAPLREFPHGSGICREFKVAGLDLVDDQGQSRRDEERIVRVWLPPGYSKTSAPEGGWPVLYLQDGQNCFEDKLSFSGCSWKAGITAGGMVETGELKPFVIVAVDHAGTLRSFDFLPAKPGTGFGGFRPEAEAWPGGGVDGYLAALVGAVMPCVRGEFNLAEGPDHVAFGGSSFGGICTLCACTRYPGLFGAALVESPAFWYDGGSYLPKELEAYAGPWPEKMFMAMGTLEASGQGGDAPEVDAEHLRHAEEAARLLAGQGLGEGRLMHVVGEGHAHNEAAWAERLPGALRFLMAGW